MSETNTITPEQGKDWPFPTWSYGTVKFKNIEKLIKEVEAFPPSNWLLVSPDGRVWQGPEPMKLAAQATFRVPRVAPIPFDLSMSANDKPM